MANPTPPTYEYVQVVTTANGVALLTLNRPQSGNSLHKHLLRDMLAAFRWADAAPDIRIIVQTGAGRFFSTGMELVDNDSGGTNTGFAEDGDFYRLNRVLINSRKVLVAAVNGPAAGYGVTSLGLFDLVYCVPDAYFFTPFVKWGWCAEGASSTVFPRIMGHQKAAAMFLAAERCTAQELERVGLISRILPAEGFLEAVMGIAENMARMAPGSLMMTKELMRGPVREEMLATNDRECQALLRRPESGEPQEAMKAFRVEQEAKRKEKEKQKSKL